MFFPNRVRRHEEILVTEIVDRGIDSQSQSRQDTCQVGRKQIRISYVRQNVQYTYIYNQRIEKKGPERCDTHQR